jgi:hypothetical protein
MTPMPDVANRQRSNGGIPLLLALVVGCLVGAAGASLALSAHHGRSEIPARADLTSFVPLGARGVIVADVEPLRTSPVLAPLFGAPLPNEPCETRLLRQVRRVLLVFGASLDEIGVAFTGELPRDALVSCARSRATRDGVVTTSHRDGVDRVRIAPPASAEFLPPAHASEIAYLPGGVVLAGSAEMVHRMFDHARSGAGLGDDAPTALDVLRDRLGAGHDVTASVVLSAEDLGSLENEPALRHVRGVALGLSVRGDVRLVAIVACDSYDAPRDVADALVRMRDALAAQISAPPLAASLRDAVIERRATEVRVTVTLTSESLSALPSVL